MSKITFYARRTVISVFLIFGIASFLFIAFRLMPGDYAVMMAEGGADEQQLEAIRDEWGLNDPLYMQYFDYMANMFTGDVGTSRATREPVVSYVLPRLGNSVILVLPGLLCAFLIGSLYGAWLGNNQESALEGYGIIPPTFLGTMPDFFMGILIIYVLSSTFGLIPAQGMANPETYNQITNHWELYFTRDFWYHAIGPLLTIILTFLYYPALVMRGSVVEVTGKEFYNYQQLVGLKPSMRFRSMMRHASLPVITILPPVTATSISGLVLIEYVFNWPGIGRLLFDSVLARDVPVIQFVFLLVAIWIVIGNFIIDIAYTVIDPRIGYDAET